MRHSRHIQPASAAAARRDAPARAPRFTHTENGIMRRKIFLTMLAATAMALALAAAPRANAQCPTCTYHVSVLCGISPRCFPLNLTTGWHCLNPIDALTQPLPGCGEADFPKVGPCMPVPCDLLWASLDNGTTIVLPNGPPATYSCADGSQICLRYMVAPNGCSFIFVTPGPC
jgi:hypothetical protein